MSSGSSGYVCGGKRRLAVWQRSIFLLLAIAAVAPILVLLSNDVRETAMRRLPYENGPCYRSDFTQQVILKVILVLCEHLCYFNHPLTSHLLLRIVVALDPSHHLLSSGPLVSSSQCSAVQRCFFRFARCFSLSLCASRLTSICRLPVCCSACCHWQCWLGLLCPLIPPPHPPPLPPSTSTTIWLASGMCSNRTTALHADTQHCAVRRLASSLHHKLTQLCLCSLCCVAQ